VYDIVVDQSVRRQGVGTGLLEATLSALSALGAPRVLLSTAVQNSAARHMFARAGFRETMTEMTRELDGSGPRSR
jgi:ribosomal protein S18 acetylase RimI-like enzyme